VLADIGINQLNALFIASKFKLLKYASSILTSSAVLDGMTGGAAFVDSKD
jgi:hypothetical protein